MHTLLARHKHLSQYRIAQHSMQPQQATNTYNNGVQIFTSTKLCSEMYVLANVVYGGGATSLHWIKPVFSNKKVRK